MTILYFKKNSWFLLFFFLLYFAASSQNFQGFLQPEIDLGWDPGGRWSYHFAVGNRNLIAERDEYKFDVDNMELTQFTAYEVGFYGKLAVGIRYRFRELFDNDKEDELRIMQQYSHKRNYNRLVVAYRFRLEERFRESTTFRNRYRLSGEFPLNGDRVDRKEFFLVAETEALWSLGKYEAPSMEQRVGVNLGKRIFEDLTGEIGLEYRIKNYTQDSSTEIFLSTKLNISI